MFKRLLRQVTKYWNEFIDDGTKIYIYFTSNNYGIIFNPTKKQIKGKTGYYLEELSYFKDKRKLDLASHLYVKIKLHMLAIGIDNQNKTTRRKHAKN